MPLYTYAGQDAKSGKKVRSKIEADSIKDAKIKLRKLNILVFQIAQDTQSQTAMGGGGLWAKLNRRPPTPEDIANATKQLGIMVRSAVDIAEALKSISEQVENVELRSVYSKIRESVSEGKSLSEAHREFQVIFSPIYVNMLAAAEKAGALPIVLKRLSDFILYQIAIRRKVVGALTYPVIMFTASIGIIMYLFVSVLPKILKAFSTMKVTLPWYTVLLNQTSTWLQNNWVIVLVVLGSVFGGFSAWAKTAAGKRKLDYFLYTAPVAGPLMQKVSVSRFSKTLATVLTSGVRILEGLQLTRNIVGNAVLEDSLDEAMKRVQDGDKLANALEKTNRFPIMVIHLLRTGEKTGKLEEMLTNIAEVYDDEVDYQITATTKLIGPVMMVFMGGVVAFVVMAVLSPMMQAMNSLR